jgi:hypothetical protein
MARCGVGCGAGGGRGMYSTASAAGWLGRIWRGLRVALGEGSPSSEDVRAGGLDVQGAVQLSGVSLRCCLLHDIMGWCCKQRNLFLLEGNSTL